VVSAIVTEKLARPAPFKVADLAALDQIIVEADAPADLLARLRAAPDAPDILIAGQEPC
jgi:hypothetical protein